MIHKSARPRPTRLFFTLCAALLLLAMVSQQSWAAGPRGFAKSALAPLEGALTAVGNGAAQLTGGWGDASGVRAENSQLRAQNAELQRQVAQLQAEGTDNQALRQALDFERTYGRSMEAAQVVGRGPDGFSITLEIDRGSSDGVRPGMVVSPARASSAGSARPGRTRRSWKRSPIRRAASTRSCPSPRSRARSPAGPTRWRWRSTRDSASRPRMGSGR